MKTISKDTEDQFENCDFLNMYQNVPKKKGFLKLFNKKK